MVSRAKPVVDEVTQHVNRNLMVAAALLATMVIAWCVLRPQAGLVSTGDEMAPAARRASDIGWTSAAPVAAVKSANAVESAEPDAAFQNYVDGKYRYLFSNRTFTGQAQVALRAALLGRERLAVTINTARQSSDPAAQEALPAELAEIADLDRKIGALLPPAELGAYDVLKDSDIEQFQLEDYAAGIANVAPLTEADKQSILYTKLVYRQRFRQVLSDSGLMSAGLGTAERRLAFADVSRALKDYQASYLQEVHQYLYDDAQFSLLSNYENSEYDAELDKLRTIAGEK